jgi:hypothetical protein
MKEYLELHAEQMCNLINELNVRREIYKIQQKRINATDTNVFHLKLLCRIHKLINLIVR